MINSVVQEIIPVNNAMCAVNEVNGILNCGTSGGDFTPSSVTLDSAITPSNGSYMIRYDCNVVTETLEECPIQLVGVKSGQVVNISMKGMERNGQWGINLATYTGWTTTTGQVITTSSSWTDLSITGTASSDNPSFNVRRLSSGAGSGNYALFDDLVIKIIG